MYRAWLALICFGAILMPCRGLAHPCGSVDPFHVSALTGTAPLLVRVSGAVWGADEVEVNFGNEFTAHTPLFLGTTCNIATSFDFEHEFVCPGTYEIVVSSLDGPVARVTVVVTEPENPVIPAMEVLPFNVFLYATVNVRPATIAGSTVDWGDGRTEDFVWVEKAGRFVTPTHDYLAGRYTATVTDHYEGPYCSSDPAYSTTFQIPLPATPVGAATWGFVKTLYRN